jgi:hypothetical protein
MRSPLLFSLVILTGATLLRTTARAEEASASDALLAYDVARGCPEPSVFLARLQSKNGASKLTVSVVQEPRAYAGDLPAYSGSVVATTVTGERHERRVRAPTCDEVITALALSADLLNEQAETGAAGPSDKAAPEVGVDLEVPPRKVGEDAGADRVPGAAPSPRPAHRQLTLLALAGASAGGEGVGAATGIVGLYRTGVLGLGAIWEYGGETDVLTSSSSYMSIAPAAGLSFASTRAFRLSVLIPIGIHSYHGFGSNSFLETTRGADAVVGFVGSRVFVGWEMGKSTRFHIGFYFSADGDFAKPTKTVSVQSAFTGDRLTTVSVGTWRIGNGLVIGGAFDLL